MAVMAWSRQAWRTPSDSRHDRSPTNISRSTAASRHDVAGAGANVDDIRWQVFCAWAYTVEFLIVGRVIQAAGASAGLVIGRAIIRDVFGRDDVGYRNSNGSQGDVIA